MKLATLRTTTGPTAVRVEPDRLVDLGAKDVGVLLSDKHWFDRGAGPGVGVHQRAGASFATLVPAPSKIVCVGLNYGNHIHEMGRDRPTHPTIFAKYADSLIGADDDIVHPAETAALDWEAELGVVIGAAVRRARGEVARDAIAGYTVVNDITARDWQNRTNEWLQGKSWDTTTPVGPWLLTADELEDRGHPDLAIELTVNGEVMQSDRTGDLVFDPVALVEYVSTFVRLNPGDVIATGTPGGVGHARKPPRHLAPGDLVVTTIEGIGELRNRVVAESWPGH